MSIDEKYAAIKKDISQVRNKIINIIEPGSIEDSLCKGFSVWYSELRYNPKYLLIGINPGAGYFNSTGVKYREDIDLDPSDVFEYGEYGGGLANETILVFKKANRYNDLENSIKINIHYLITSNQKDLFLLQGILLDKYNINMFEKAKEWTIQLIDMINPQNILCEGAYPAKRIAEYYDEKIIWENNICEYQIKGRIKVLGYKRLFSKILNKNGLVEKLALR